MSPPFFRTSCVKLSLLAGLAIAATPAISESREPLRAEASAAVAEDGVVLAQAPSGSVVPAQDGTFVAAAARGSAAQVQLGRLAADTTGDTQVAAFAARMVHDHRRIGDRLQRIGQELGLELPDRPNLEAQDAFDLLNGLSGTSFDRSYMEVMVKDHETAVALFAKQGQSGENEVVRAFAEEALPVLKAHLEEARSIAAALPSSSPPD